MVSLSIIALNLKKSPPYSIQAAELKDNLLAFQVHIDAKHIIFDGHFPAQPIVPGIVLLDMVKTAVENIMRCSCHCQRISQIKFLKIVDPEIQKTLSLRAELETKDEQLFAKIVAYDSSEDVIMKGSLQFLLKNTEKLCN